MNALLVDTSSWINFLSGKKRLKTMEEALLEGRVYSSPIIVSEILSGNLSKKNRQIISDLFLDLPMCPFDIGHWIRVGEFRNNLQKKGLKVSTPDSHIALACLELDCYLLTEDRIFSKISNKFKSLKLT